MARKVKRKAKGTASIPALGRFTQDGRMVLEPDPNAAARKGSSLPPIVKPPKLTKGRMLVSMGAQVRPEGWSEDPGVLPDDPEQVVTMYHFTSHAHLPSVLEQGILRGDVPITSGGGFNAPWLTTDPSWGNQKWANGSAWDKAGIRFTVKLPKHSPLLHHWPDVASANEMDPFWFETLNKVGGESPETHLNWWLFFAPIPMEWATIEHKPVAAGSGLYGIGHFPSEPR